MSAPVALDTRRHAALASATRVRILDAIESAGGEAAISQVAAAVDLHANTVRAHLELLEEAGLLRASLDRSGRRGRPRLVYQLADPAQPEAGPGDIHAELARVLLAGFGRPAADAAQRAEVSAERIGGLWGGEVSARRPQDAVEACLASAGVEIAWRTDGAALVRECPLADLARLRPDVVCPLHARMLAAALEEGAGIDRIDVQPNVGGHCVIRGLGLPA